MRDDGLSELGQRGGQYKEDVRPCYNCQRNRMNTFAVFAAGGSTPHTGHRSVQFVQKFRLTAPCII